MLNSNEIQDLKSKLPRGYFPIIVERVPYSERTVANFFKGATYKIEIHKAALDLIQEEAIRNESVAIQHKAVLNHE